MSWFTKLRNVATQKILPAVAAIYAPWAIPLIAMAQGAGSKPEEGYPPPLTFPGAANRGPDTTRLIVEAAARGPQYDDFGNEDDVADEEF